MASINVSGIGSGIDINSLVEQLVTAERQPVTARLDSREARYQAQISGFGTFKSALSTFRTQLSQLSKLSTFETLTATSSDTSLFTATAASTAKPGTYQIGVNALAQSHTLVMAGVDNLTDVVGTGTLTFKLGTTDYNATTDTYNGFTQNTDQPTKTLTIDASNNTLAGIRDAINDAKLGVSASIIYDGSQYRLTLAAATSGAANSLQIGVADSGDSNDTDANGLSRLAFNAAATNLTQTVAGQDAQLTVNGLAVTSSTNTVSGAINGVTLDLKKANVGQTANLTLSSNTTTIATSVRNFVTSYNELVSAVASVSSYNATAQRGGVLMGDSVLRGAMSSIRGIMNDTVQGLGGSTQMLADIGITTNRDGTLTVDDTRLNAALASDPGSVGRLFAVNGSTSTAQLRYLSATRDTEAGNHQVNVVTPATQGSLLGAGFGYSGSITIGASNASLALRVDGVSTATLSLSQGTYTGAELAAEIQSRINGDANLVAAGIGVNVAFDTGSGKFSITSNRYGSASKVEITAVGATSSASLGLSVGAGTTGVDVVGSIGGLPASGSGRVLTGSGTSAGMKVEVLASTTGALGNVSFTRGVADRLNTLVGNLLAIDGSLNNRIAGLEDNVKDIDKQREALALRLSQLETRLRAQFTAMDALVGQLKATSTYLEQQLANLPTIGGNNR